MAKALSAESDAKKRAELGVSACDSAVCSLTCVAERKQAEEKRRVEEKKRLEQQRMIMNSPPVAVRMPVGRGGPVPPSALLSFFLR